MRRILLLLSISVLCCTAIASQAQAKRALTPNDYYAIKSPGDPQISPDGKLAAYTVASVDRKENRRQTEIWMAAVDGSRAPRKLTSYGNSNTPRWSPDGRTLAFLSARRDPKTGAVQKPQVYALSMSGGEARRLTDMKNGVSAFEWSPDSGKLACISQIGPSDSLPPETKQSDEHDYVHPEYKEDGLGFFTDRRNHIWVVDIASGATKQVSFGDQQNDFSPQWSPDGTQIAYIDSRTDSTSLIGNEGIYVVPATGGTPRMLSNIKISISSIRWSPQGNRIAYIGSADKNVIPKIWIAPAAGGPSTLVSNEVTYARDIRWAPDGNALFYLAPDKGDQPIFRIDLNTHKVTPLTSSDTVREMNLNAAAKKILYISSDDTHPLDVFALDFNGSNRRQLTRLNDQLLSDVEVQPDQRLTFKSVGGWKIEGFFTKPLNWQQGKSYPMILMVHGGPNGMWSENWDLMVQCFAAQGWAVLRINPRGSSGYGEAFQRGVYQQWGGNAYQDLMNGIDYALLKYPWVDKNRLGVTGHSYGGFMTNWIIGHTTRFKAAVPRSGMTDFISDDGARDAFYGHQRDFGMNLFDDFDYYLKMSPVYYASKVKTPTLFLYGGADMRVPLEQGEEYFRALQHFGVPSELVIFPGEPHTVSRNPRHVVDVIQWPIYWFERWIDKNPNAARPIAE